MNAIHVFLFIIIAFAVPAAIIIQGYIKFKQTQSSQLTTSKKAVYRSNITEILERKFPYYKKLPLEYQNEFCQRTLAFSNHFKWKAAENLTITDEMKILISATAIQLTFGLKKINFSPFNTIVIYPDAYYSNQTRHYHKGEVNSQHIVLSWKHFIEGLEVEDDKINLGLHELAHALDLSTVLSKGRKFYLSRLLEHFRNIGSTEYMRIREGFPSFLRSYGGTNLREFFSVAVEHFFEAPNQFKNYLPKLYDEMCLLLNQDLAANIYRGVEANRFYKKPNELSPTEIKRLNIVYKSELSSSFLLPIISSTFMAVPAIMLLSMILIPIWGFSYHAVPITLILFYFYTVKNNYSKIIASDHYLVIFKLLKPSESIALSNILFVDFNKLYTYETVEITYIDQKEIKTINIKLYFRKNSILLFKKLLIQEKILVRQNKLWTKSNRSKITQEDDILRILRNSRIHKG